MTVAKSGTGGNRGEQNRRVLHLAKNVGAEKITLGAGFRELIECDWISRSRARKILAQHRADLILVAGDAVLDQVTDDRAKEEPPEIESTVEAVQPEGFDREASLAE